MQLLDEKLNNFRFDLVKQIDSQFDKVKNHVDKNLDKLTDKIDNHEKRIKNIETNITSYTEAGVSINKIVRNFKWFVGITIGINALLALSTAIMVYTKFK
jgi:hypothetical protein